MKKLRIAALIRDGLIPPESATSYDVDNPPEWKMEFDILATLGDLGHEVRPIGL